MRALRAMLAAAYLLALAPAAGAGPGHGIAMHGEPALAAGFTHFPYVNPDAPKGGEYREAVTGSFDSLNPFIVRGQAAAGTRTYLFESLMARSRAEPFTLYGLIAESIEVADDRSWVTFRLNPRARFSDGHPVTAADVRFSLETLRDHGRPNYRTYYSKVKAIETPDAGTVTYRLDGGDRELVLILGLMPVLPRHYFEARDFEATTLEPPVGSGPYVLTEVLPGERLVFRRDPGYWGRDLAVNRGMWNFDTVRFDYFRDALGAFEEFKKGRAMLRAEDDASRWATAYDFPAVASGQVVRETVAMGLPKPAASFVFNTRRPLFADKRVREALVAVFDFAWVNANLFHGLMARTEGFFSGSALSAVGRPASEHERAMLAASGAEIRPDILDGSWRPPASDGSGRDRKNLRKALSLLNEAGWTQTAAGLVDGAGRRFTFEITVASREQERIALTWQRQLRTIGADLTVRQVDSAQFQRRLQTYDYDMIPFTWYNSLSPGNEQAFYWGSRGRTVEGTRNYMGADDPAIDAMIDRLLDAADPETFADAARGLDRLLIEGHYVLPLFNPPGQWIARWRSVERPDTPSLYGFMVETAWSGAAR